MALSIDRLKGVIILPFLLALPNCLQRKPPLVDAQANSRYLKEIAKTPVQWKQWHSTTLAQAKNRDQLIFLNIGYTACEPCGQLQNRVFKDSEVSDFLNTNFISIAVDREQFPEVNSYFLNLQSLIMGFAGWPINIILTPDLKPVFVTTFAEPKKFLGVLQKSQNAWQNDRKNLLSELDTFADKTQPQSNVHEDAMRDQNLLQQFYARYTHQFDSAYGGKKGQTKFLVNLDMRALLFFHEISKDSQSLKMLKKTLVSLSKSSMFDHLHGGFYHYSKTSDWNSPGFEKTLLDQATALHAYIDFFRFQSDDINRITLVKLSQFLLNELSAKYGGFYTSLSGINQAQAREYYSWSKSQIQTILSANQQIPFFETYTLHFAQTSAGRVPLLRRKTSFVKPGNQILEKKLMDARSSKDFLVTDEMVVTATSSYTLAGLAKLLRLWPSADLEKQIRRHMDFILSHHRHRDGRLYHSSFKGHVEQMANLADYAFTIDALLELHQTTFDQSFLHFAKELQAKQDELFYSTDQSLYRFSSNNDLLPTQFLFTDLGLPSALSQTYWNLLRLGSFYDDLALKAKATDLLQSFPETLELNPLNFPSLLVDIALATHNQDQQILSGDIESCRKILSQGYQSFSFHDLFKCHKP